MIALRLLNDSLCHHGANSTGVDITPVLLLSAESENAKYKQRSKELRKAQETKD